MEWLCLFGHNDHFRWKLEKKWVCKKWFGETQAAIITEYFNARKMQESSRDSNLEYLVEISE